MASTTTKGSGTSRKTTGGRRKSAPPAKRPVRRETGGIVCLVLALCAAVSYFGVDAVFIDWFAVLLKGLFGYGYWLAGPALALTGVVLLLHHGRPVALRVTCALLMPLLFGALAHMAKLPVDNTDTFQQWLLEHFEDHGDTVMEKRKYATEKNRNDAVQSGVLYTSGLIAGEGIVGIVLAIFAVVGLNVDISGVFSIGRIGALVCFAVILYTIYAYAKKGAKTGEKDAIESGK